MNKVIAELIRNSQSFLLLLVDLFLAKEFPIAIAEIAPYYFAARITRQPPENKPFLR